MNMNTTPNAQRPHVAFFGRRNAGKSSLVNQVTGQALSVVSPQAGTTTDPVLKAMELHPAGPVVIIDTPGFDDEGALGELRVKKTRDILSRTDFAVLVTDAATPLSPADKALLTLFQKQHLPFLLVRNKTDLLQGKAPVAVNIPLSQDPLLVSALTGEGISLLKEQIAAGLTSLTETAQPLAGDLVSPGSRVLLVIPIDEAAPRGRLILPQQQVLRDCLDAGALVTCCRDTELPDALGLFSQPPDLVVTDSQVFGTVAKTLPSDTPLTSFSILMARHKGYLETSLSAITALEELREGDLILIAEGCTHHRQCSDIGTVKIPRWLKAHSKSAFSFETVSGHEFPDDLTKYRLVIHCGGCMLNEREVRSRVQRAKAQGVPFLNYGVLIAHMNGILKRSTALLTTPLNSSLV